ncbi:MAG: rhomboid family intramembrane serine protease, partial [Muribaculaceae bacterium]|nr:rhomboid family intramembrane serine protease [Muribaculaceae bacterium]
MQSLSPDIIARWQSLSMPARLIAINIAVFAVVRLLAVADMFGANLLNPVIDMLSVESCRSATLMHPWTLLTYMWVQYDPLHLLFNMLALYLFGRALMQRLSSVTFILLYIVCGVVAAAAFITAGELTAEVNGLLLGASGAVSGILTASALLLPNQKVNLLSFGLVKLKWIALPAIALFALGLAGSNAGAHVSHLGGMAMGALFAALLRHGFNIFRPRLRFKRVDDSAVDPEGAGPEAD